MEQLRQQFPNCVLLSPSSVIPPQPPPRILPEVEDHFSSWSPNRSNLDFSINVYNAGAKTITYRNSCPPHPVSEPREISLIHFVTPSLLISVSIGYYNIDDQITLWDAVDCTLVKSVSLNTTDAGVFLSRNLTTFPDHKIFLLGFNAIVGGRSQIRAYNAESLMHLRTFTYPGYNDSKPSGDIGEVLNFPIGGQKFIVSYVGGLTLRVWDIMSDECEFEFQPFDGEVDEEDFLSVAVSSSLSTSGGAKFVVVGCGQFALFDFDKRQLDRRFDGVFPRFDGLAFSPSGLHVFGLCVKFFFSSTDSRESNSPLQFVRRGGHGHLRSFLGLLFGDLSRPRGGRPRICGGVRFFARAEVGSHVHFGH